jgi:hypothetical protein
MARNMKQVTPDDVRKWAVETNWRDEYDREVATRGRLSTKLVTDYNNANRRYAREYVGGPPGPRPRSTDVARSDNSNRTPARQEKATPAPARQRTRAEDEDEAPMQVASERIQASGDGDQTSLMVQDVIAALAAAQGSRKGNGRGEPTLLTTTVSAHKLVYI